MAENSSPERAGRGAGRPFPAGTSGNPGGRPRKLRELDAAIQAAHGVPEVLEVLAKVRERALAGDIHAAKVYLDRVAGPVKANDDERIEARAEQLVDGLITQARAARSARMGAPTPEETGAHRAAVPAR